MASKSGKSDKENTQVLDANKNPKDKVQPVNKEDKRKTAREEHSHFTNRATEKF